MMPGPNEKQQGQTKTAKKNLRHELQVEVRMPAWVLLILLSGAMVLAQAGVMLSAFLYPNQPLPKPWLALGFGLACFFVVVRWFRRNAKLKGAVQS